MRTPRIAEINTKDCISIQIIDSSDLVKNTMLKTVFVYNPYMECLGFYINYMRMFHSLYISFRMNCTSYEASAYYTGFVFSAHFYNKELNAITTFLKS